MTPGKPVRGKETFVALRLFHGRSTPEEELEDWGKDGPIFFLGWAHMTYLTEICLMWVDKEGNELDANGLCSVVDFDPEKAKLPSS